MNNSLRKVTKTLHSEDRLVIVPVANYLLATVSSLYNSYSDCAVLTAAGAALQGGGAQGGFSPPVGERLPPPPSGNFGIFRRGWPLAILQCFIAYKS